jgi:NAD(P)-dependent dehydrogenase (short-subunit alcohol dehydrogenase family)
MSAPVALVTGANRGLGFETAKQLLARGWSVLLAARDRESGAEAARALGKGARFVALDVTDRESVTALSKELDAPLSALVNNAGSSFDGFDAGVARRTLEVNYRGPVRVTDTLADKLVRGANVVMVSSAMGELSRFSPELQRRFLDPGLGRAELAALVGEFVERAGKGDLGGFPRNAYSVSKAALNAFTRIAARELAPKGVRVNAICPGWVRTRMGGKSAPRSLEQGASGIVWAATLDDRAPSGGFFRDGRAIDW